MPWSSPSKQWPWKVQTCFSTSHASKEINFQFTLNIQYLALNPFGWDRLLFSGVIELDRFVQLRHLVQLTTARIYLGKTKAGLQFLTLEKAHHLRDRSSSLSAANQGWREHYSHWMQSGWGPWDCTILGQPTLKFNCEEHKQGKWSLKHH